MDRDFKSDVLNDLKELINENEELKKKIKKGTVKWTWKRPDYNPYFSNYNSKEVVVETFNPPKELEEDIKLMNSTAKYIDEKYKELLKEKEKFDAVARKEEIRELNTEISILEKDVKRYKEILDRLKTAHLYDMRELVEELSWTNISVPKAKLLSLIDDY